MLDEATEVVDLRSIDIELGPPFGDETVVPRLRGAHLVSPKSSLAARDLFARASEEPAASYPELCHQLGVRSSLHESERAAFERLLSWTLRSLRKFLRAVVARLLGGSPTRDRAKTFEKREAALRNRREGLAAGQQVLDAPFLSNPGSTKARSIPVPSRSLSRRLSRAAKPSFPEPPDMKS